jgi:hypothetical protein
MDVDRELIEHLSDQVHDQRFSFHHLNLHNKMYNPQGKRLTLDYALPLQEKFTVICLFSVFTHFEPGDVDCMLAVLRRYIEHNGKLIFTCFLDEDVSGFDDRDADSPLKEAAYTEFLLRHLITRNGWDIEALYPPTKSVKGYWLMQHCFVCALPAADRSAAAGGPR